MKPTRIIKIVVTRNEKGHEYHEVYCNNGQQYRWKELASLLETTHGNLRARVRTYGLQSIWVLYQGIPPRERSEREALERQLITAEEHGIHIGNVTRSGKVLKQQSKFEAENYPLKPAWDGNHKSLFAQRIWAQEPDDDKRSCEEMKKSLKKFNKKMMRKGYAVPGKFLNVPEMI